MIDGLGGSGKTTQVEMLKGRMPDAVFTKEPGGAPRAEKIRFILKEGDGDAMAPLADFFLFWAARAEHIHALIRPALSEGKTVVSDRFDSSTFAMQVRGDEQSNLEDFFWQCRSATLGDFAPDTYIILDAAHATAKNRRTGRNQGEDRFDDRGEAYQLRVREGYKEFVTHIGGHVIDAGRRPEEVAGEIWRIVEPLIT